MTGACRGKSEAFIDKAVTMTGLLEAVSMSLFGHTLGPC
jgi:hypothetical protein